MKKLFLALFLIAAIGSISAQELEKLPIDPSVRYGQLENGLTYYIRHNEQPKQRCEFHIAQSVGAILEEDHQNGLAHFLEHMAFNGTEHFPGKGIINYFESIGVNFGGNINAYTSIDETVYRLSDVPTYREGIIDSALLVMHDWSCGLLLLPDEIDAERGVIVEEWRTGRTAQRRIWKELNAQMYPGTQYAKRDVIGDTAVIINFEYQALRDYYTKWYRPDNQAIIVVGDIDVDAIEAKIKALWKDVPRAKNFGERTIYTVNHNEKPLVAIVTDPEAQGSRITLEYKFDQLPEALQNTAYSFTIEYLVNDLICDMLNNRFSELALDPNASFTDAGCYYSEIAKKMDAFNAIYLPKEGKETQALQDLLYQVEKMRRYGFTNAELERVKAEMLNSYEKWYNERNTRTNISLARECIRHFEDRESMPGIEWEYEFIQATLPLIKIETINKAAQAFIHPNPTVAISGAEKKEVNIPSEQTILNMLNEQTQWEIEAPKEEVFNTQLVKKAPRKGKIKEVTENKTLGTTEWMLSNGVKVVFKTTDFKADEILMQASSKGGESQVATADLPSAQAATAIVQMSGVGEFSMTQLEKALTGKTASISPTIGKNTESMKGSSSVKDFETLLQLNYLYFTAPRRDEQAYNTVMEILSNQLANRDKNPKSAFSDSIQMMASNHSERTILFSQAMLDQINLDKALQIYKERFANPADFTFIFVGNINPNDPKVQALVCQWIGGLKTKKCYEDFIDHKETVVLGQQRNYFSRQMQTTTASNRIQYTSYDIPYTLSNDLNMIMIGRILGTRYLESIREREGGSYGVGTAGRINFLPNAEAILIMQFDTDPQKQERLMQIIHEEVQTIIKNGPLATDLQKEKESMLKDFQEDLESNSYWRSQLHLHYLFGKATVNEYEQAVKGITAETVQDILKRLVDSKNMFEVVMFPEQ